MTPEEMKALRRSLGITQSELATVLGLENGTSVSRFERGARTPSQTVQMCYRELKAGWTPEALLQILDEKYNQRGAAG